MILADTYVRYGCFMQNIRQIEGKEAVVVPLKDWEKMQRDLIRLRKRLKKAEIIAGIKQAVIRIETDLKNENKTKGKDARKFVDELLNEK